MSESTPVVLPANGWTPRPYQLALWRYLWNGGTKAAAVWHRRSGKDDVALHWTCAAANAIGPGFPGKAATYWHMLPQADQARKAVWEAVNPSTGKRRIDEAFPKELRAQTRESDMFIRFHSGSTYQVVGSDNYESLIGSPPAGIVFSEWSKAKPQAWAMLSPILAENKGWALFIYTPRGMNHGLTLLETARKEPGWFGEVVTAEDTGVISPENLAAYRRELHGIHGEDYGDAVYRQEMLCDFSAPILGAIYPELGTKFEKENRITMVPHDPDHPVFTAWDLGYTDDTAIWWYQVVGAEVRILEFYESAGKGVDHYASQILGREVRIDIVDGRVKASTGALLPDLKHRAGYRYAKHWLPHDAKAKTMAAQGRSIIEQLASAVGHARVGIVPNLSREDGIQAARLMLKRTYFNLAGLGVTDGLDALRNYQREWDEKRQALRDDPLHDWTSHAADAFRMMAVAWREKVKPEKDESPRAIIQRIMNHKPTLDELWDAHDDERGRRVSRI